MLSLPKCSDAAFSCFLRLLLDRTPELCFSGDLADGRQEVFSMLVANFRLNGVRVEIRNFMDFLPFLGFLTPKRDWRARTNATPLPLPACMITGEPPVYSASHLTVWQKQDGRNASLMSFVSINRMVVTPA